MERDLVLPAPLGRGWVTAERRAAYDRLREEWCDGIIKIWHGLDFEIGTREWCYLLEDHGLRKVDFDKAERLIVQCRKDGLLPLNIVIEDAARAVLNLEAIDETKPDEEAENVVDYVSQAHLSYHPISFWDYQEFYVEVVTEKASLRSLFEKPCSKYHVPVGNLKGSSDLHSRANILRRFAHWQAKGKKCVLLDCTDFDVHGLRISNAIRDNLAELLPAHWL
jgi:hypothetical protein